VVSEEKIFRNPDPLTNNGPILVSDWLISKKIFFSETLGQMNRNGVGSILGRSSIKISHLVPIHQ
jgi:hypothetical protein